MSETRWRYVLADFLFDRQDGLCPLCGETLSGVPISARHIDHIVPKARGGLDEMANLQVTHAECNTRKGVEGASPFPRRPESEEEPGTIGDGDWVPPPKGSQADMVLDALGRLGRLDYGLALQIAQRNWEREGLPWPVGSERR